MVRYPKRTGAASHEHEYTAQQYYARKVAE
jgi:hypothetical protein